MSTSSYVGGIEGGGTRSQLIVYDDKGTVVADVSGPGTNHWLLGIPECARRIAEMVTAAKVAADIPPDTRLKALGLSLSGCEQEATNRELEQQLRREHPSVADSYVVCSDTVGSIFTAAARGGLVLIAGTGSNALLRNPNGTQANSGGWGHILGDEGAAWWISHRAIKTVFDDEDGFAAAPASTARVWSLIREHFGIETRLDLLDHCYAKFDKSFFAGLCLKLAAAADEGDELALKLFGDAGMVLARHVLALLPKVERALIETGELKIVCVGSVWKSWAHLKSGFVKALDATEIPYKLTLLRLTQSMGFGACYLAADSIGFELARDYSKNYEVFYTYAGDAAVNGQ